MAGNFNPRYDGTASRPAHVDSATGTRLWHEANKRLAAQDVNGIIAKFRHAMDEYGVADTEGDDTLLTALLQAVATPWQDWTPTFSAQNVGDLVPTYHQQQGRWMRIGNLAKLTLLLDVTPTYTTSTGFFRIFGIPIEPSDNLSPVQSRGVSSAVMRWEGNGNDPPTLSAGRTQIFPTININADAVQIQQVGSAANDIDMAITQFTSGSRYVMQLTIEYEVDP